MTLRILHAADLHLDSPLEGVQLPDSLDRDLLRMAPRKAFERLVSYAIVHKAHLVLIAGDVFDDEGNDARTVLWLRDRLRQLDRNGIQVAMLHGNHDHAALGANFVKWPENVFVFPKDAPATKEYEFEGRTVCVHGQSFPSRHTTENLSRAYPKAVAGAMNIGLLHTSLIGTVGHDPYAPCSQADLESKGYDYWALGHVHKRQAWEQKQGGWIAFCGNLQGRDMGEAGEKGFLWLEIDKGAWEPKFVPSDVLRFREETIDLTGSSIPEDFEGNVDTVEAFKQDTEVPELVRLRLIGRTKLHAWLGQKQKARDELVVSVLEVSNRHLESIKVRTAPERSLEEVRATDDLRSAVVAAVEDLKGDRESVEKAWTTARAEINKQLGAWLSDDLKEAEVDEELWSEVLGEVLAALEEVH